MSWQARLDQGLQQGGNPLSESQRNHLLSYLELLQKWNKVHNLTAVRDPAEMVTLHLLDSLSVLPHINVERLLDVGSGAGLPGIPLAVCRPDLQVAVMDASQKKASFMRQAKAELGLNNLEVLCGRVEQYQPPRIFDAIISRAFSDLKEFVSLTRHLLMPGGSWLAMKGARPHDELAQLPADAQVIDILPLHVPGLDAQRHLVVLSSDNDRR